jgi:hypothetical protein
MTATPHNTNNNNNNRPRLVAGRGEVTENHDSVAQHCDTMAKLIWARNRLDVRDSDATPSLAVPLLRSRTLAPTSLIWITRALGLPFSSKCHPPRPTSATSSTAHRAPHYHALHHHLCISSSGLHLLYGYQHLLYANSICYLCTNIRCL